MSLTDVMYDFGGWLQKTAYKQPKIEFYSTVEGLDKFSPILPATKAVPDWYRKMPRFFEETDTNGDPEFHRELPTGTPLEWGVKNHTIKSCPGIQDILTSGYINTFWGHAICEVSADGKGVATVTTSQTAAYDTTVTDESGELKVGENGDYVNLSSAHWEEVALYLKGRGFTDEEVGDFTKFQKTNHDFVSFSTHPEGQYDLFTNELPDNYAKTLLKLHNPWRIKTPKGYSTMITSPLYHMHPILETLPGIIDTDYYHSFNAFFMLRAKGVKFEIPFGLPIAHYHVVKRTDFPYELRTATHEDLAHERVLQNMMNSHWGSSKPYRMMKKIFSSDKGGKCPFSK